jgi:hypothetical protein
VKRTLSFPKRGKKVIGQVFLGWVDWVVAPRVVPETQKSDVAEKELSSGRTMKRKRTKILR